MIVTQRERERQRHRQRESRLHAPGARRGIRSRVSRIAPWAKGRRQTAVPPRDPKEDFKGEETAAMNELGGKRLAQASERQWGYDDLRLITKACSEFLKEK